MASIQAICISEKKGEVKLPVPQAEIRKDWGIVGDAHAGNWHRQVSLLPRESIEGVKAVIPDLKDGAFAENFITYGLDLSKTSVGSVLEMDGGIRLEVTQIGKECHQGCAIQVKTGDCIMPKEGIFCRVLEGGFLKPNAEIRFSPHDPSR